MPAYEAAKAKFAAHDAQVVGISVDSVFSHMQWQKSMGGLSYPLAADFYPHGAVAQSYGVFRDGPPIPGISERAIFIVDKTGTIAFSKVYQLSDVPPNQDVFDALEKIAHAHAHTT